VSGGGANLHIHRTTYTKRGKDVELHSSYFKELKFFFFKEKNIYIFKYFILVLKDDF